MKIRIGPIDRERIPATTTLPDAGTWLNRRYATRYGTAAHKAIAG
jgi:hypothetical protein